MPTISMFYGIIIRMYYAPKEHNTPHIHVYYQDDKAIIDINRVELTEGKLPKTKLRIVLAWVELRKEELLADWDLAQNGELPFKIDPLKQEAQDVFSYKGCKTIGKLQFITEI